MAARITGQQRVSQAEALLLLRRSPSQVVAELAESEGISRRSARRYVARALAQLQADTEVVDRAGLVSLLVDALNRSIAMALDHRQPAAVIGACRELDALLGLGSSHHRHERSRLSHRY